MSTCRQSHIQTYRKNYLGTSNKNYCGVSRMPILFAAHATVQISTRSMGNARTLARPHHAKLPVLSIRSHVKLTIATAFILKNLSVMSKRVYKSIWVRLVGFIQNVCCLPTEPKQPPNPPLNHRSPNNLLPLALSWDTNKLNPRTIPTTMCRHK
jgi:hypothetical protein